MRVAEIDIKQACGKNTVSREDAKVIYEKVKQLWRSSDLITVNFGNLLIASVSFLDEAFGQLALAYSQEELRRKLKFENINEYDRALLNDILLSRFRQENLSARKRGISGQTLKRADRLKRSTNK